MNHRKKNIISKILLIGIILIPFMSFPVLPSDYRPVSIFFLVPMGYIIFLKYLIDFRISKDQFILVLFLLTVSIQSIFLINDSIIFLLRNITPLFIGIFSYIAFRYYFIHNSIETTYKNLIVIAILISLIGVIEILSINHILPYEIKYFMGKIFSNKISSRIQLTTMEGSWAAKVIIFFIPIYIYFYNKNKYFYKSFFILIFIFILIFSLEGYFIVLCTAFFYFIFRFFLISYKIMSFKYKIKYYIYTIILLIFSSCTIYYILHTQTGYAISRIYKFLNADSFFYILSIDASTFIRIIYPYIGFLIFLDHPFGVGLGGYSIEFNNYINNIPINFLRFDEVIGDINTISADPKNLYAKIASETGIIGLFLIGSFIYLQIKYLKYNIRYIPQYRLFLMINFLLGLCSVVQFSSFAYLPFWFAFAVNASINYKLKKGLTL